MSFLDELAATGFFARNPGINPSSPGVQSFIANMSPQEQTDFLAGQHGGDAPAAPAAAAPTAQPSGSAVSRAVSDLNGGGSPSGGGASGSTKPSGAGMTAEEANKIFGNQPSGDVDTDQRRAQQQVDMWRILEQQNGLPVGSMGPLHPDPQGFDYNRPDSELFFQPTAANPTYTGPYPLVRPPPPVDPVAPAPAPIVETLQPPPETPFDPIPDRLKKGNMALDSLYGEDYFPSGTGQGDIDSILGGYRGNLDSQLKNMLSRKLIMQSGYDRAETDLDKQQSNLRPRFDEALTGLLTGERQTIKDKISGERNNLSSLVQAGDYDSTPLSDAVHDMASQFTRGLRGQLSTKFPESGMFDARGLSGLAGASPGSITIGGTFAGGGGGLMNDDEDDNETTVKNDVLF